MKRALLLWALLPQLMCAQYQAKEFTPDKGRELSYMCLNAEVRSDSIINLDVANSISGLFITGTASLQEDPESYIRVTLKDRNNAEYLVYENYPIMSNELVSRLNRVALESCLLNNIIAKSIKVELKKATLDIDSIFYTPAQDLREGFLTKAMAVRHDQSQYIVDQLNAHLQSQRKTWRAGITSVSQNSYEEMKSMFGGKVPMLYGFERYKGGVFVMPSAEAKSQRSSGNDPYVPEWDWRNRHGKNWVTRVKNQGGCQSCWAFSAVATLEAYINRYYNQVFDDSIENNLSEQDLISCSGAGSCGSSGGLVGPAFSYIENNGIVLEGCFEYTGTNSYCGNKCPAPTEVVSLDHNSHDITFYFEGHDNYLVDTDSLKRLLFKSPVCFGIMGSWNHQLSLIGYKTIQTGDSIFTDNHQHDAIPGDSLIGQTAWLMKNSWGKDWGNQGFGYVVESVATVLSLSGPVHSLTRNNSDIICEDADGDGYYNWGVGEKPSHCPAWAPTEEDGDDSDPSKGPLTYYGFTTPITPSSTIYIDTDTLYSSGYKHILQNICVRNNSTFTVSSDLSMNRLAEIRIKSGSTLIVEGVIRNANIQAEPGSTIILNNGGQIITHKNDDFVVPVGVILQMNNGKII